MMTEIAFLGLGTMGSGMVRNLLAAGHHVTAWNRTPGRATECGATEASTVAEAVCGADVVMYCLADDDAVHDVVFGADGLEHVVAPGSLVIDLSTISPEMSDRERSAIERRGADFLDAPVFGSKGEAAEGGLWVVVGGEPAAVERAKPVLEPISASIHHLGPGGAGVRMKLCGNLVVASQLLALGESLTLAQCAGLDLHGVLDVLSITDFRSPIFDGVGPAVLAGDYSPSFKLKLMQKDAGLISAFAERLGVPVPSIEAAGRYIDVAVKTGRGDENASALIEALAESVGVSLRSAQGAST